MIALFIILALLFLPPASLAEDRGAARPIAIDPGHGGYDSGIKRPDFKEKDVVLDIAKEVESLLRGEGRRVLLTRTVDRPLSMAERTALATNREPGLFLSLHLSGTGNFAVYVTWYGEPDEGLTLKEYYAISARQRRFLADSRAFAADMETALKEGSGRGVYHREMSLPLLNPVGAPAILIEAPSKSIKYDDATKRAIAQAIVNGVISYERKRGL